MSSKPTYHFEYGETTGLRHRSATRRRKLAAGRSPGRRLGVADADLKIGTVYHFRVVATNAAGTTLEPDQTFTTVPPALIESDSALEVSSASAATLAGADQPARRTTPPTTSSTAREPCKANPAACTNMPDPTRHRHRRGEAARAREPRRAQNSTPSARPTTTACSRSTASAPPKDPNAPSPPKPAETPFALADNRAWEMVSPPNKHGAPIEALTREGGLILAAEDGELASPTSPTGRSPKNRRATAAPKCSRSSPRGRPKAGAPQDIATPNAEAQGVSPGDAPEYQFFTPDLSLALVEPWGDEALGTAAGARSHSRRRCTCATTRPAPTCRS